VVYRHEPKHGIFTDEHSFLEQLTTPAIAHYGAIQKLFEKLAIRSILELALAPPFGGIKRPHVKYDSDVDTCGFVPPQCTALQAASIHVASLSRASRPSWKFALD